MRLLSAALQVLKYWEIYAFRSFPDASDWITGVFSASFEVLKELEM